MCVRSVTNFLNEVPGIERWEVDTDNPDKILTVEGPVKPEAVVEAIDDAGFDISLKHRSFRTVLLPIPLRGCLQTNEAASFLLQPYPTDYQPLPRQP